MWTACSALSVGAAWTFWQIALQLCRAAPMLLCRVEACWLSFLFLQIRGRSLCHHHARPGQQDVPTRCRQQHTLLYA